MVRQIRGTVNYVELIGWIGDDPEQRSLTSGATMCMFRVATKRPGPRTDSGKRTIETDWLAVEAWDQLALLCMRMLHKGSRVRVVGSLHTQSWDDKATKQRRYKTVVRADEMMIFDSKSAQGEAEGVEADADLSEESEDISY